MQILAGRNIGWIVPFILLFVAGLVSAQGLAPTALYVHNEDAQAGTQGDPVNGIVTQPRFSAVFNHGDGGALAIQARVQFATDSAFTSVVGGSSWQIVTGTVGNRISDVAFNGSALQSNTRYWWRIRIRDDLAIDGPWSIEAASFVTTESPQEPTTLFVDDEEAQTGTQGDPVANISHKPSFSAIFTHDSASATASEARVQFATDVDFTSIAGGSSWQVVTGTSGSRISDVYYNGNALECGVRYYWRIRIKDSAGIAGPWSTEPASFITVECPDEAITLFVGSTEAQSGTQGNPVTGISIQPSFSAIVTHTNASASVVEGRVQFALDAGFASVIGGSAWQAFTATLAGTRSPDISYNGSAIPGNTRIYWRIRFRDPAGITGPWSSEEASFETVAAPLAPTVLFVGSDEAQTGTQGNPVANISQTPRFSAIFNHQDTGASATSFRVQIATDALFESLVHTQTLTVSGIVPGTRLPDLTYAGPTLSQGATYHWRARARDHEEVWSPWNIEPASFTVASDDAPFATLSVDGLLQGAEVVVDLTKSDGPAFPAGCAVEFDVPEIEVTQVVVVGANQLQLTVRTQHRASHGSHTFEVVDGTSVVARGSTVVFHPLQRLPFRIGGAAQESLNSATMLGVGVCALQGEFKYIASDVELRGRRLPLTFRRAYRSFLGYNGATGQSWSSVVDAGLRFVSSEQRIEWLTPDGRLAVLNLAAGGQAGNGPYVEVGRYIEWLRFDADTPSDPQDDFFVGTAPQGDKTTYRFGGLDVVGEPVYRLVRHEDRFGNHVEYIRDAVGQLIQIKGDLFSESTATRHVLNFEYDTDGRLARIQDYADYSQDESHLGAGHLGPRIWDFIYDQFARLVEVRGPATAEHHDDEAGTSGRIREVYEYLAATVQGHHLMQSVYLPVQANLELSANTGVPWLRNYFDASHRVFAQDVGALSKTDETHRRRFKYAGSIVDEIDQLGRRVSAVIDSQGRPLQLTSHTGTFGFDQSGDIQVLSAKLRATDPDTYTTTFEYNQHGEATRIVLPKGNERRRVFDTQNPSQRAHGNLLRAAMLPGTVDVSGLPEAQRNGFLVTYDYEPAFNLPTEEVPSHAFDLATSFDITQPLTGSGQLTRDEADAYRATFEYDMLGRLIRVSSPLVAAAQSPGSPNVGQQFVVEYEYNAFGQMTSSRDMSSFPVNYAGIEVDYEYGVAGFDRGYLLARVADPSGISERVEFAHDSIGQVRTVKAPHGAVQTTVRDQLDRVVKSISPAISSLGGIQYTVALAWDQNSNLVRRTVYDPVLDAQGQPTSAVREIVDEWSYGVFGNMLSATGSITDQTTRTFTSVYDAAYQLIELHTPGGTKSVYTYDELGRTFRSFNGLAVGATSTTGAISSVTVDYDHNGNTHRATDPRGFERTTQFDAYDRVALTEDARSPVTTRLAFIYSHAAAPAEIVVSGDNGTGNRVTLAHRKEWLDNLGRMFRSADWAVASDLSTPLGYSPMQVGTNDTPGWSVATNILLPDGRPMSKVGDLLDGASPHESTASWTMEYDGVGRTTRILDAEGNIRRFVYSDSRLIEEYDHSIDTGTQQLQISRNAYEYDELNRVISRQACTQDPVLFRYDARGNPVHVVDPRSGVTRLEFDHANRLVKQSRSGSGLWSLSTSPTVSTTSSAVIESVFEYDLDDNLTRTIDNAGNQRTYSYDLAGRLIQTHFANGGKVTVGTSHTLTPIAGTAAYVEGTGGYDASDNLLQLLDEGGNRITRTFSPENEVLTMVIVKGQSSLIEGTSGVSWQYDGLGRVLEMITSQLSGQTHTRTHVWNSLSLIESYQERVNAGTPRQYLRQHDESGRNHITQSPDATVTWTYDLIGRMKSYTVSRAGRPTLNGAWTYFGRRPLRTARAVSGDEDVETQRDQRGRVVGVRSVSRLLGGSQRSPFRYLYDGQTGRMEGMLNEARPVTSGESRIGQPSDPNFDSNRVFGSRTFFDGLGRVTGYASDVSFPESTNSPDSWDPHPDTQATALQFDAVDFPTETGSFLGQQFPNGTGAGHLTTPHTQTYGSTTNPLPQGDGSRLVPDASGDVELEKTSDDQLKIANDGSNAYVYDYQGRVVRTERVSDDAVISTRAFDGTGIVYDHQIYEYLVVNHDFAAPNLAGMTISTPNVRFDGGSLRFVGVTDDEFVQFSFPADVRRNSQGKVQGGLTSYHDFLLDHNSGSGVQCNFYFVDYRSPGARFRLEVGGTVLNLYFRAFPGQSEALLAQGSLMGISNGPVALGIKIGSTLSFAPTTFEVFVGGSSRLSHSQTIGGQWTATNIFFEAGDETTRLYRYKGYLDFDFTQADLRMIELTPEERMLQMLCGSNVPAGTTTPTHLQDNAVAYQMYKDQVIDLLAGQGDAGMAQIGAIIASQNQSGDMGCGGSTAAGGIADLLASMEAAMQQAYAAEACVSYGNALTDILDDILVEAEGGFSQSPAPADLGAFLVQNNQLLDPPSIEVDPVVNVGVGEALTVPFKVRLPFPQQVQIEATGPGGSGLPAGLAVNLLTTSTQFGALEYTGEITWTPPAQAEDQSFDVHIRVMVPATTAMDGRPFAEAMCRVQVLPNLTTAPVLSVSASPNVFGESPFEFGHSQEEFHTTFAGEVYALWQEDTELMLDFAAFSDVDSNFTWDAIGLTGTWGIASNGDTAQIQWQFPQQGMYTLSLTASNSAGQGSLTVRLRVMPASRAWNIRREHTSVVTCVWRGQSRQGAVWGDSYGFIGHKHTPWLLGDPGDALGIIESYIGNGSFVYQAGFTAYQISFQTLGLVDFGSSPGPNGPLPERPDGLISRAAVAQQIQNWTQQFRDQIEFLNDQIAAFGDLINSQLAEIQRQGATIALSVQSASVPIAPGWDAASFPELWGLTSSAFQSNAFGTPFSPQEGTEIHRLISADINRKTGGQYLANRRISTVITRRGGVPDPSSGVNFLERPDLVHWTTGEVYEIKPHAGNAGLASGEATYYAAQLNAAHPGTLYFPGGPKPELRGQFPFKGGVIEYRYSGPGAITYERVGGIRPPVPVPVPSLEPSKSPGFNPRTIPITPSRPAPCPTPSGGGGGRIGLPGWVVPAAVVGGVLIAAGIIGILASPATGGLSGAAGSVAIAVGIAILVGLPSSGSYSTPPPRRTIVI